MSLVLHGYTHLVVFVHDVHREVLQEAVAFDNFPVICRIIAVVLHIFRSITVCCVAFHDGAVYFKHQVLDKFGFQVVRITAFACAHLDCHASLCGNTQRLVYFH